MMCLEMLICYHYYCYYYCKQSQVLNRALVCLVCSSLLPNSFLHNDYPTHSSNDSPIHSLCSPAIR